MSTFLFVRGMEPVEIVGIGFNGAQRRIDQALTGTNQDGTKAPDNVRNRPMKKLEFKTVDEDGNVGRFSPTPDNVIGLGSTVEKDADEPNAADDDE